MKRQCLDATMEKHRLDLKKMVKCGEKGETFICVSLCDTNERHHENRKHASLRTGPPIGESNQPDIMFCVLEQYGPNGELACCSLRSRSVGQEASGS